VLTSLGKKVQLLQLTLSHEVQPHSFLTSALMVSLVLRLSYPPPRGISSVRGWVGAVETSGATGSAAGVRFRSGTRGFSAPQSIQTDCAYREPLTPGWGLKRKGREADSSPPSSAKVKNGGALPVTPSLNTGTTLHAHFILQSSP
jgi:hypothetical protein